MKVSTKMHSEILTATTVVYCISITTMDNKT